MVLQETERIGTDNVIQRLARRAAEQSGAEALTFLVDGENDEVSLTYGELDLWARQIAIRIRDTVSGRGERVMILCPPGLDYVAAFYGTVYAGAVPVLFSPPAFNDPPEVFSAVVAKMDPALILAPGATRFELEASGMMRQHLARLPWLATDDRVPGSEDGWREPAINDDDIAYIMLTSGTTSVPKGTIWDHRSLTTGLEQGEAILSMVPVPNRRIVSWAPLYHIGGLAPGILMPVYLGYPATLMSPAAFTERPLRWLEAVSRTRATAIASPTFAYDLCARLATERDVESLDLSCVLTATVGAEMVRPEVLERFAATFARSGFRADAFNPAYGMTEGGVSAGGRGINAHTFSAKGLESNRVIPCGEEDDDAVRLVGNGPIIPSVSVAFVDPKTLSRRAPGEVGELLVSGPLLARGYLGYEGDPDVGFDTYLPETGEGPFFRTGDLAFLSDNQLFIAGRAKEIIIIRGRNVSPHDLEVTAQRGHPSLAGHPSAAFSLDVEGEERLAIVQEVDPDAGDHDAVIGAIRTSIAGVHEIQPYAVVLVPPTSLPRTAIGKIQRGACREAWVKGRLPVIAQQIGTRIRSGVYAAPRTPEEAVLAHVWEELLGVDQVGLHDNFFELGGDSVLIVQATARARQLGLSFSARELLEHPTIAELAPLARPASSLDSEQDSASGPAPLGPSADQSIVSGPVPLTPRQHQFFRLKSGHDGHVPFFETQGTFEPSLAERAVEELLVHHDSLRTRFTRGQEIWEAAIAASEEHEVFSFVDVSRLPENDRPERMQEAVQQARARIDIERGPLLQAVLIRFDANGDSRIVFLVHHLVVDPMSIAILIEDFNLAYRQLAAGQAVRLPAKTTSYKAWAERLVDYAQTREAQDELQYWIAALPGRVAPLPVDHPEGLKAPGRVRRIHVGIDRDETEALFRRVPRVYGAQGDRVLLAALTRAIREWSGAPGLLVELAGHGREELFTDVDVSRTVGWFTTHFPVYFDIGDGCTASEAVRIVEETLRRVPHAGIGHGILRFLCRDREVVQAIERLPVVHATFNYPGRREGPNVDLPPELLAAHLERQAGGVPGRGHGRLKVVASTLGDRLVLSFGFHDAVYEQASIERLAELTRGALRAMLP